MPCILILYDGQKNLAYWVYIQSYLRSSGIDIKAINKYYNINIPVKNRINKQAIKKFSGFKQKLLDKLNEVLVHEE